MNLDYAKAATAFPERYVSDRLLVKFNLVQQVQQELILRFQVHKVQLVQQVQNLMILSFISQMVVVQLEVRARM